MLFTNAIQASRPGKDSEGVAEWLSFEVFQKYSLAVARYTEEQKQILPMLDLAVLSDPSFWQILVKTPERHLLFEYNASVRFAIGQLPKVMAMLKRAKLHLGTQFIDLALHLK